MYSVVLYPKPKDYAFYLDLWQQPYAVSRYYDVPAWSDKHLELLKPYAEYMARAGQKAVTTVLFYEPWGEQSNDKFEPMVETVRESDGTWSFDYTIFDRYVEFMAGQGIDKAIDCFTMVPWEMKFRYLDSVSGEYRFPRRSYIVVRVCSSYGSAASPITCHAFARKRLV